MVITNKQITFATFLTQLSIPFTCTNMAVTFLVIFIWYFSSSGLRLCLYTKGLYCLYTTKNTIVMSIYFETLQLSSNWKLVTNLKTEILLKISIFNFFGIFFPQSKWRLHMSPLKNFDTRWYYNIHKSSQKNYLNFGFQKTATVDNYGERGRGWAGRVQWTPLPSFPQQRTF